MNSKNSQSKVFLSYFVYCNDDERFFLLLLLEWEDVGDEELSVWQESWDDDNLDNLDDFNEQLKQQMKK